MKAIDGIEAAERHRKRLAAWRASHPGSRHRNLELDELEALKAENDRLARKDVRERPDVCASYPSFLTIGNTHKCNLTCQMCFKQLDDAENMTLPDMGLARFERVAHELFPHVRTVALSVTGEPLVSRSILAELDLLATYGVRASITSNGMPLSKPGLVERMLPATDTLVISMDGASEPTFNAIRRQARFDRVVANIRLFNHARDMLAEGDFRPRLHFAHILQHRNVTELPRLIELAHELEVDRVHVDHVFLHETLNPGDSLLPHRRLTNRTLEEARATAQRLGVELRLPEPFDVSDGAPDAPYEALDDETLLTQGRVRLDTVRFDPELHERWDEDRHYRAIGEVRATGGGNAEYVEALLEERALIGHLSWGVPQLGPSLIPPDREKISACAYAWRESFIEYNGLVAPCCNPAMGAGRLLGHVDDVENFRDVWNGEAYRELRRSLSSGRSYKFCRTCYLVEPVDEASWGSDETWVKVGATLEGDAPVEAGRVPPGRTVVLTEVRSGPVNAASRLEIRAGERLIAEVAAVEKDGAWSFGRSLDEITLGDEELVQLRSSGVRGVRVDLIAYVK